MSLRLSILRRLTLVGVLCVLPACAKNGESVPDAGGAAGHGGTTGVAGGGTGGQAGSAAGGQAGAAGAQAGGAAGGQAGADSGAGGGPGADAAAGADAGGVAGAVDAGPLPTAAFDDTLRARAAAGMVPLQTWYDATTGLWNKSD